MAWSREQSILASLQGWDVFDNSERGVEIERVDDMSDVCPQGDGSPIFVSDDDALAHVKAMAAQGDAIACAALHHVAPNP